MASFNKPLLFDADDFQYSPDALLTFEKKLRNDGYVQIQFSPDQVPDTAKEIESFFVDIIIKVGGRCRSYNDDPNSIIWHVQPLPTTTADSPLSHSDQEIPFHTDISSEKNPHEYMALFVLEQDRFGGGKLELIQAADVVQMLSSESKRILMTDKFKIKVPVAFKKFGHADHIDEPIIFGNGDEIRYNPDIVPDCHTKTLEELKSAINQAPKHAPKLEKYSIIIFNNRKFLHSRTKILDPRRHLLRIWFNMD